MPLYSEEIQDIMGRIPSKILKIGLTIIFAIILLLLIGSYFFKYPEIIKCPIVLITINPPHELYARSTGKIAYLKVQEHDTVQDGCLVAILHNTASYKDTQILERCLKQFNEISQWDSIVKFCQLPENLFVGELQSSYLELCKIWRNFSYYLKQNYLPLKISLQTQQIKKTELALENLHYRQKLEKRNFELEQIRYKRDSAFYQRFPDAISVVDYEKQTQAYLQKQSSYLDFCSIVNEAENNLLKQREQLIDLKIQHEHELHTYRQEIHKAYKLLYENYYQWQEKYVLISNINGIVTLTGYWSENQTINAGDLLATIIPLKETQIIGKAVINMKSIGKVRPGQNVNIKLHGFPYTEFGMLKGHVRHISLVPEKEKGYIAEISLSEGMRSSYRKQLNFIQQIEGTAEIIITDKRLLSRLIEPLKAQLDK